MRRTIESVPKIYSTSFDMRVFFALLDVMASSREIQVARIRGHHSPIKCFEEDLKHLASLFNLPSVNRELLSKYMFATKSKGTEKALIAAFHFAGAKGITVVESEADSEVDEVTVSADMLGVDYTLLHVLLERWFPVSIRLKITYTDFNVKTNED